MTPPISLLAAAALLAMGSASLASDLPERDPSTDCRAQAAYDAQTYGFDEAVEAGRCLSTAQAFYDAVRANWASLPEPVRQGCVAEVDAGHTINTLFYWSLYQCIDARRGEGGGVEVLSFRFGPG